MIYKIFYLIVVLTVSFSFLNFSNVNAQSLSTKLNVNDANIINISNEKDLKIRKVKIEQSLTDLNLDSESKNTLQTKIPTKFVKTFIKDKKTLISKYESKVKNYWCWDGNGSETAYALAGNMVYRFSLRINACADYNKVYNGFVRTTWADIGTIGWSYQGLSSDRSFNYINGNQSEFISSRQGVFKLCVNSNWACVKEDRPWVEYHATRWGQNDYWY